MMNIHGQRPDTLVSSDISSPEAVSHVTYAKLPELGAAEMARGIKAGSWTSRELVEAHIARIRQIQPLIGAVAVPLFEEARRAAAEADRLTATGKPLGPLHGVPVSVKESLDAAGTPSTWGLAGRTALSSDDDPAVAALRRAGAVVLAKTNAMQLLMGCETVNPVFGRTSSPWNPAGRSSGGSSGGEAALIAAGGSPLGLGTDVGGSIRTPAHFCGVHGLKPTPGRVASRPPAGIVHICREAAEMACTGPLARKVEDLALAMEVLAAPETLQAHPLQRPGETRPAELRIGYYTSDGILPPSPAVERAVLDAAEALRARGVTVKPFRLPEPALALQQFYALMSAAGAEGIAETAGTDALVPQVEGIRRSFGRSRTANRMLALILRGAGQKIAGTHIVPCLGRKTRAELGQAVELRQAYREKFAAEMERQQVDVLLSPPFLTPAIPHDHSLAMTYEGSYALLYNYLGMPAGVVSLSQVRDREAAVMRVVRSRDRLVWAAAQADRNSAGLPVGVQVAAAPWREDRVLAVMDMLEKLFRDRPDYPPGKLAAAFLPITDN
ncbi:amidase [Paenibacillus chitinolyticus]|uniref:amidase n=1 Tax=Paenibacillus chitinolyticus TaxID=79263 RepID=UPI0036DE5E2F